MKALRTIRLDATDPQVFPKAAEPGEWAISGALVFSGKDPESLDRKERLALGSGFLGIESFGWSTFVSVAEIDGDGLDEAERRLAALFVSRLGAPDLVVARQVAHDELEFAREIADSRPVNSLIRVEREPTPEGIREQFRGVAPPREPQHAKIFEVVPDGEDRDD